MNLISSVICILLLLYPSIKLHAESSSTPWLGLDVADVTVEMARKAGLDRIKGALIEKVYSNSPAQKAGLKGQDIIISLNGRGIRTAREFKNDLSGTTIGERYQMCIARAGYRTDVYVIPEPAPEWFPTEKKPPRYLGVKVAEIKEGEKVSDKLEEIGKKGVLVTDVIPGSPADHVGIEPGDIIMSLNFRKVRTLNEFLTDLSGAEIGWPIRMCIMRGDVRITLYPVPRTTAEPAMLAGDVIYSKELNKSVLSEVLPHADIFQRKELPLPHYVGYKRDGQRVGIAFVTTEVCPEETWGYQSRISTLVGLNGEGKIVGIKILKHNESLKYVRGLLEPFTKQYLNKDLNDEFILRRDIHAITGATVTSSAINRSIKVGLSIVSSTILNEKPAADESQAERVFWQHIVWQIDFLALFIMVGLAIYGYLKNSQPIRYFTLGLSFFYLGILKGGGLSINDLINVFQARFPVIIDNIYWYSLLIIVALSVISAGRFYCGWLCPFGGFLELLGNVNPTLSIPYKIDGWLRSIKYILLIIIFFIVFVTATGEEAASITDIIEPFGTFFRLMGSVPAWIFLISVLLFSFLISRLYCRYLCPLGALLALLAILFSFIKSAVIEQKPPKHRKKCPMDAIKYAKDFEELNVTNSECIRCSRWIE